MRALLENITNRGFRSAGRPVNPLGAHVSARPSVRSLRELDPAPDLVIVAIDGDAVLELAAESGRIGASRCPGRPGARHRGVIVS